MESFLGSLSVTRTLLVEALVAMVILSILVTIFYEAIKANLQISFRKRSFEGWWKRLMRLALDSSEKYVFESDTPNIVDATGRRVPLGPAPDLTDRLGFDTETGSFEWEALRAGSLPDELFMRKIENMGRTILERPAKNP